MRNYSLIFITAAVGFAGAASATPITYSVSVDTSTISGTDGALDFNFGAGPLSSQPASLQVINFQSDGILTASPSVSGEVSGGPLPNVITLGNGGVVNDYFDGFKFGSSITFNLAFDGPALSAPDGLAGSGSAFAFSLFADAQGTIPVLTNNSVDGYAFTVDINLDGRTSVVNYAAQTTTIAAVPAPAACWLFAVALTGMAGLGWRRA